jgi:hypothetical protein
MAAPTAETVLEYLGDTEYTEDEIGAALASAQAAQKARCRVPADDAEWPADLVEALCRRTHRALTLRALPLGLIPNAADDGQAATTRVGTDTEVRALEAPWRRLVVG